MFWHGMGFELKPAGEGWKEGVNRLHVTMISWPEDDEEQALKNFIRKIKSIPDDDIDKYVCKHNYLHTEDCRFCSAKKETE